MYVTDEQRLRENYRNVYNAFARFMNTKIHYACKANTNLAILRVLEQEGSAEAPSRSSSWRTVWRRPSPIRSTRASSGF